MNEEAPLHVALKKIKGSHAFIYEFENVSANSYSADEDEVIIESQQVSRNIPEAIKHFLFEASKEIGQSLFYGELNNDQVGIIDFTESSHPQIAYVGKATIRDDIWQHADRCLSSQGMTALTQEVELLLDRLGVEDGYIETNFHVESPTREPPSHRLTIDYFSLVTTDGVDHLIDVPTRLKLAELIHPWIYEHSKDERGKSGSANITFNNGRVSDVDYMAISAILESDVIVKQFMLPPEITAEIFSTKIHEIQSHDKSETLSILAYERVNDKSGSSLKSAMG